MYSQYNKELVLLDKSNNFQLALKQLKIVSNENFSKADWAYYHFIKAKKLINSEKKEQALEELFISKKKY